MSDVARRDNVILTLRVIVGVMAIGVVVFGAVVIFVLRPQPRPSEVLLVSLGAFAVAEIVAWVVVGRLARRRVSRQLAAVPPAEGETILLKAFFNLTVVGAAMCEALCFFALIVHLLTGAGLALIAAVAGLAAALAQMPSAARFEHFADGIRGRRPI